MKRSGAYTQVVVQMYLKGMDSHELARRTGISYPSLRRKLRGDGTMRLEEAISIQHALACELPLEELFVRREQA